FRYPRPRYKTPSLPAYSFIVISFVALGLATLSSIIPSLNQLGEKLMVISSTAVAVEIVICIQRRRFNNLVLTLILLGLNLFEQSVSGWKGNILWSTIVLGAM